MTFQEAYNIVMSNEPEQAVERAVKVLRWYSDNTLELEDYETDKLYQALEHINKRNEWHTYIGNGKLIIEPHNKEIEDIIKTDDFKNYVSEAVKSYTNRYSGGFKNETNKD